jgi:hypothetical protein
MENVMRKPRDLDAKRKSLEAKARDLKSRKVQQLGELVIATRQTRSAPTNWRVR